MTMSEVLPEAEAEDGGGRLEAISEEAQLIEDADLMKRLLKDVTQGAKNTRTCVQNLIDHVKSGGQSEGISFLDMKNRLLSSYTSNLGLVMLRKCYGKGLEGEEAISRLVENRTVLEKIRPIDQKLRYQVDKLVNIADTGTIDQNDPLRFKPNPSGLMSKLDDEASNSSGEEGENDEKGGAAPAASEAKFRPPRNVPQFFNAGEPESQEKVEVEKKKKHQLSKSIMESIKEQYMDTPEEVSHKADVMRKKFIDEDRERTRLEEEHFVRLPVTKADKARKKAMMTMGSLGDDLTSFGKSVYEDGGGAGNSAKEKRGKKRKGFSKSKGSKKFKKRK
eukprot:TRINITY_DN1290_c0_g1_i4.p1 TRINITY_DN1290_c0_g1~~TRINITY_DN1290_c0_g1_i4.p1  ORF type:complete len:334 (-),score=120.39 TRINITY_DN1290_c0_g1_i4:34-1035(-)